MLRCLICCLVVCKCNQLSRLPTSVYRATPMWLDESQSFSPCL
uniref:Uncharacterized protein n=1 Tax=Arundo donax TaxID=35708 RepID=A0A0A9G9Z2_ARUDO